MVDARSPTRPLQSTPLEASSPFELRVDLSADVSESAIKKALESGDIGFLHSFTTGSTVDGPGVRLVAWTSGCQFKCLYCHNPDTWRLSNGMPVPLARATEELRKYRHGLRAMAGGLTLSGGEPLMQDRFAVRLFTAAKEMGVHTVLDTNGFLGDRLSDVELEKIDLVLLDIKGWEAERHRHLTGKDNGPVLDFARRLAARKRPVWVRFVLVPGLTDDLTDVEQIANFCGSLGNVARVDVLPFHQLGQFKWKELGMNYTLNGVEPPAESQVHRFCEIFRAAGLVAH
jgi:pyruvate formate lyase activating enzyme